jgi:hypothetical protein
MNRIKLVIGLASLVAVVASSGCTEDPPINGVDCSNYEQGGVLYDCEALDRCTETDFQYLLACCNCDPAVYCRQEDCGVDVPPPPPPPPGQPVVSSCMRCHNGDQQGETYKGEGITNPHPFGAANYLSCVNCHGGDPNAGTKETAHVPRPPAIGDDLQLQNNAESYFNFLTHAGLDKVQPYNGPNGQNYTGVDYLQFINPGDMRVMEAGRSCGAAGCHNGEHATWVPRGIIATEAGFYSATMFAVGVPNENTQYDGWYGDTASEYGFRAISDPDFVYTGNEIGRVGGLYEFPERAGYPNGEIYNNNQYDSNQLPNLVYAATVGDNYANSIQNNTVLEYLVQEIVAITCGDCHLGHRGANNRYADFRSSGCSACHMKYSMDGRSRSTDPNVNRLEPANADAIAAPEDSHPKSHQITNVAKILPNGGFLQGTDDTACVGCHQGSNRTVLQYWGIRLDQNKDLVNNFQYPANPVTFVNTAQDPRLFDAAVNNNTFNGRDADQYILFEDYEGDGRDDTPPDLHHAAGMGCIDCHGSRDVHNGTPGDASSGWIVSREDQAVKIQCASCHGGGDEKASYIPCTDYNGNNANCAYDLAGNPLRNVTVDGNGDFWVTSRVTGNRHFVPQTYDTIRQNNKINPQTGALIYSAKASYAMGRADGNNATGIGPLQQDPNLYSPGFSHLDGNTAIECQACHAGWQNNCIGCHLAPGYDNNVANYFFSNTTGERIILFQAAADFTYISPLQFNLGVGSRNMIATNGPGMKMFWRYDNDLNNNESNVLGFTDRRGNGNNPNVGGRGAFPALPHNKIQAHTIRGRIDANNEAGHQCNSCHLNVDMVNNFGADYAAFWADYNNRNYANFDFNLLQEHIGQNPNNHLNSPYYVHMAAGLGTGLYLFDAQGCPVNPLDANPNRFYCNDAPANLFDLNNVVYDLDRVAESLTGVENISTGHPFLDGGTSALRIGANAPDLAGTLGRQLLEKLADPNVGLVLDSWVDSDTNAQGGANNWI